MKRISTILLAVLIPLSCLLGQTGNIWHIPLNTQAGIPNTMRDPFIEIDPSGAFTVYQGFFKNGGAGGNQNGGSVYYRNVPRGGTAGAWQSVALGFHADEGSNQFWKADVDVSAFGEDDVIEYYVEATFSDRDTTYAYGGDLDGNTANTGTESVAQASPYSVRNRPGWLFHADNRVVIGDNIDFWIKLGYISDSTDLATRYADQGRVYYTTDGSEPSGSLGTPSGTTSVASFVYDHPEQNEEQNPSITGGQAMWWKASVTDLLAGLPLGSTVKYRIGFWHSETSEEKFADQNAGSEQTFSYSNGTIGDPVLTINGLNANYTTSKLFIDEIAAESESLSIVFEPGKPNVIAAEVYTNLNRRDRANEDANNDGYDDGIVGVDGNSIVAGDDSHYYKAYTMASAGAGTYTLTMNADKTGAYRLTARFKVSDAITENGNDPNNWIWYSSDGRRDHAITVSPIDALNINLYEINVFNIEATGDTFATRSTFEDLHDAPGAPHGDTSSRWNLDYLKDGLGSNWLWFQPIHPNGIDGREPSGGWGTATAPYDPGSPYAVKNFFEVNQLMTKDYNGSDSVEVNRARAMTAFQNFAAAADAKEVGIMLDAPFNHSSFDVELAQQGVDLFQPDGQTWSPLDEIRNRDARFFSKNGNYGERASSAGDIAAAPDRGDFGKWNDVKDIFFGRYASLVETNPGDNSNYLNEGDWFDSSDPSWTNADFVQGGENRNITRLVWKYFSLYAVHWLEKTGYAEGTPITEANRHLGIDGLRCDFGQGLPPQAWEYIINVARERKWNFVMMSESLDGGAVTYRSNRHFDILNENIVFPLKVASNAQDYRNIYEDRRNAYGLGLVLSNNTSHDEENYDDPWEALIRYSVGASIDGVPLIFPGQELGISRTTGYNHYETNFGKLIPHFKRWNSMDPIWNDTNFGNDQLYHVYGGMNQARLFSPALRSQSRFFMDGDGFNGQIFSVAKYEEAGASPASSDVVFAFVNLDRDNNQSDNYKIPSTLASLVGIKDGRTYNVRNIAAYTAQQSNRRDVFQWGSGITGADLKASGFFVNLYKVPLANSTWIAEPFEAQYLKLYDVTPPPATDQPFSENMQAWVVGDSVTFNWDDGTLTEDDVVTDYRITVGTTPGGNDIADSVSTGGNQYYTATASEGQSLYASIVPVSAAGILGSPSTMSAAVQTLSSSGDEDFDGQNNNDEAMAGTDPLDANSVLRMGQSDTASGGGMILEWPGVSGVTYTIQFREHLVTGDWATVATVAGADGTQNWEDADLTRAALNVKFYRVIIASAEP
ncbi:hypothetical protein [Rubellicoccus peritrichatus]|uniref:Glycosyl hydrolase family 13 catalytic domain-containing protein n=1 Tax=Rubellicoccus peritrichatus TaxID=3080537 RepID=A0AAQ3L9V8_9BACT|nr:hypothetical protein [Puniceicoccus sp. CR14]WOO41352.1 hypothetical protein RZN69_22260 [Puniceicoccus sp. CR14]